MSGGLRQRIGPCRNRCQQSLVGIPTDIQVDETQDRQQTIDSLDTQLLKVRQVKRPIGTARDALQNLVSKWDDLFGELDDNTAKTALYKQFAEGPTGFDTALTDASTAIDALDALEDELLFLAAIICAN